MLARWKAESRCQWLIVAADIKSHWKTTNDRMKQCPLAMPFVAGTRDIGWKWEKGLGHELDEFMVLVGKWHRPDYCCIFLSWTNVLLWLFLRKMNDAKLFNQVGAADCFWIMNNSHLLWMTKCEVEGVSGWHCRIFFGDFRFLKVAQADLYEAFGCFGRHNSRPLE